MSNMKSLFSRGFNSGGSIITPKPDIVMDEQQLSIVCSVKKNILVVAGAGSGKTRVLTERVKYLISQGVPSHNIVAITFTNMAAEEMRERLADVPSIGDAFIGTIHSFANRVMSLSGQEYSLYTSEIDLKYHRELIQKYGRHISFDKYLKYCELRNDVEIGRIPEEEFDKFLSLSEKLELKMFRRSKEEIENEKEALKEAGARECEYPESIYTLCEENGVISFDELLKRANEYFRSIGARVDHLLVDEFQDVGNLEFGFIESLNAENNFFVGDDYQSLYAFKGGNVKLFMHLVEDSNFEVYYLTKNYRNCKAVLDTAETVINQVMDKIPKEVDPVRDVEGKVEVMSKMLLPDVLRQEFYNSDDYKDWFILTRTNRDLFKVANLCSSFGIPTITFKREGLTLSELRNKINKNAIKVLTVHTSKGLESKNVILYGDFPLHTRSWVRNEDERKVMYVGVTRAEDKLIILN